MLVLGSGYWAVLKGCKLCLHQNLDILYFASEEGLWKWGERNTSWFHWLVDTVDWWRRGSLIENCYAFRGVAC